VEGARRGAQAPRGEVALGARPRRPCRERARRRTGPRRHGAIQEEAPRAAAGCRACCGEAVSRADETSGRRIIAAPKKAATFETELLRRVGILPTMLRRRGTAARTPPLRAHPLLVDCLGDRFGARKFQLEPYQTPESARNSTRIALFRAISGRRSSTPTSASRLKSVWIVSKAENRPILPRIAHFARARACKSRRPFRPAVKAVRESSPRRIHSPPAWSRH
jgi:hypothetical protein